jgi:hypothetical protein
VQPPLDAPRRVIYAALGDYSLWPDHGHLEGAVIVGVAVQMPPAPSERDLYEELLVSMGCVLPAHQGVTTLRQRTRVTARQLEVRMLVIDEIHSILAGTFREQRIVLNAIRFLANDLRIPLVCVGTREAKQALMTNQKDPLL